MLKIDLFFYTGGAEMNQISRLLLWFCDFGSHILFYIFAFLLAPIGIAASATGNRKLVKIFIILASLTIFLYLICLTLFALGLA